MKRWTKGKRWSGAEDIKEGEKPTILLQRISEDSKQGFDSGAATRMGCHRSLDLGSEFPLCFVDCAKTVDSELEGDGDSQEDW